MPNLGAHCAISKQRTGFAFEELHRWIDSPAEELGADHRFIHHAYNRDDANTIRRYWDRKKGSGWGDKVVIYKVVIYKVVIYKFPEFISRLKTNLGVLNLFFKVKING